eukprot:TRINITY_DN10562_c0_g2_i1.p1 TRINITY_DN10562_c0_g2~~TRINITY_DN10562_c0_g2_i1.p1  ORF type:complete len:2147 (-),score=751.30 TRINITY_DN10562_c0_g2_i1:92-6532(-)
MSASVSGAVFEPVAGSSWPNYGDYGSPDDYDPPAANASWRSPGMVQGGYNMPPIQRLVQVQPASSSSYTPPVQQLVGGQNAYAIASPAPRRSLAMSQSYVPTVGTQTPTVGSARPAAFGTPQRQISSVQVYNTPQPMVPLSPMQYQAPQLGFSPMRNASSSSFVPPVAGVPRMPAGPPQPPAKLTSGIPDPASIESQKAAYNKSLEEQAKAGEEMLKKQQKQQMDQIFQAAEAQKKQAICQIEQEAKKREFQISLQYSQKSMSLQQEFQIQKLALEQQAHDLAMEYQQRKSQEEMMQMQYEMQKAHYDDQVRMLSDMNATQQPNGEAQQQVPATAAASTSGTAPAGSEASLPRPDEQDVKQLVEDDPSSSMEIRIRPGSTSKESIASFNKDDDVSDGQNDEGSLMSSQQTFPEAESWMSTGATEQAGDAVAAHASKAVTVQSIPEEGPAYSDHVSEDAEGGAVAAEFAHEVTEANINDDSEPGFRRPSVATGVSLITRSIASYCAEGSIAAGFADQIKGEVEKAALTAEEAARKAQQSKLEAEAALEGARKAAEQAAAKAHSEEAQKALAKAAQTSAIEAQLAAKSAAYDANEAAVARITAEEESQKIADAYVAEQKAAEKAERDEFATVVSEGHSEAAKQVAGLAAEAAVEKVTGSVAMDSVDASSVVQVAEVARAEAASRIDSAVNMAAECAEEAAQKAAHATELANQLAAKAGTTVIESSMTGTAIGDPITLEPKKGTLSPMSVSGVASTTGFEGAAAEIYATDIVQGAIDRAEQEKAAAEEAARNAVLQAQRALEEVAAAEKAEAEAKSAEEREAAQAALRKAAAESRAAEAAAADAEKKAAEKKKAASAAAKAAEEAEKEAAAQAAKIARPPIAPMSMPPAARQGQIPSARSNADLPSGPATPKAPLGSARASEAATSMVSDTEANLAEEEALRQAMAEEEERLRAILAAEMKRRQAEDAAAAERKAAAAAKEAARQAEAEAATAARLEEEARLREEAEQEERRKAAEEAEALRRAGEEEAQRLADEEEARRQKAEEEEEMRKQAEEKARLRALALEEERLRREAEEAAARLAAEEEERRKAFEAEEDARKKAVEEEARLEAEEAKRKAEESEEARLKAEADEKEAQRKAEEAEEAKRQAEEAQRKAEEDESSRLAAEEAQHQADEKQRQAEEAQQQAEKAQRLAEEQKEAERKAAEEAERKTAEEETQRAKAEEEAAELRAQESARRKEAEQEQARIKAEEDRKAQEALARKQEQLRLAADEEARQRAEEEEARRVEAVALSARRRTDAEEKAMQREEQERIRRENEEAQEAERVRAQESARRKAQEAELRAQALEKEYQEKHEEALTARREADEAASRAPVDDSDILGSLIRKVAAPMQEPLDERVPVPSDTASGTDDVPEGFSTRQGGESIFDLSAGETTFQSAFPAHSSQAEVTSLPKRLHDSDSGFWADNQAFGSTAPPKVDTTPVVPQLWDPHPRSDGFYGWKNHELASEASESEYGSGRQRQASDDYVPQAFNVVSPSSKSSGRQSETAPAFKSQRSWGRLEVDQPVKLSGRSGYAEDDDYAAPKQSWSEQRSVGSGYGFDRAASERDETPPRRPVMREASHSPSPPASVQGDQSYSRTAAASASGQIVDPNIITQLCNLLNPPATPPGEYERLYGSPVRRVQPSEFSAPQRPSPRPTPPDSPIPARQPQASPGRRPPMPAQNRGQLSDRNRPLPRRVAAASEASSAMWSAPLASARQAGADRNQGASAVPGLQFNGRVGPGNVAPRPDQDGFQEAVGHLTQALFKGADKLIDSARSGSSSASWMRPLRRDRDSPEEVRARESASSAVDQLFGNASEIQVLELFYDAPFDEVDLSAFEQEVREGLRSLGLSSDEIAQVTIALSPGSIVVRISAPGSIVSKMQDCELERMKVFNFPAYGSRKALAKAKAEREASSSSSHAAPREAPVSPYLLQRPGEEELDQLTGIILTGRSEGKDSALGHLMDMRGDSSKAQASAAPAQQAPSASTLTQELLESGFNTFSDQLRKPSDTEISAMAGRIASSKQMTRAQEMQVRKMLKDIAEALFKDNAVAALQPPAPSVGRGSMYTARSSVGGAMTMSSSPVADRSMGRRTTDSSQEAVDSELKSLLNDMVDRL